MTLRRPRADGQEGIALITVILVVTVAIALVVATLSYATGSQRVARSNQDWNAALSAAEAGIDDYITYLNNDTNYWKYHHIPLPAFLPSATSNPAMSGFRSVPGLANDGRFKYTVDTSKYSVDGTIQVTSTGKVRKRERTVRASVRRQTFLDFLYYTDFETLDPDAYDDPDEAEDECGGKHWWDPDPPDDDDCVEIVFGDDDVIRGPLHSNDRLYIADGAEFRDDVTTSFPGTINGLRYKKTGGGTPSFRRTGDPAYKAEIEMPPSNSEIREDAKSGGCVFTGPTRVVLNANGTMTVTSRFSKDTTPTTDTVSRCATTDGPFTDGNPHTVSLPDNGVLYVQPVPSAGDENHTATCPVTGGKNPLGYPISGDVTTYQCKAGDLFIEGTLNGQLTAAAENDIIIIWDLLYAGGQNGDDLLGLVAYNSVRVYHPVNSSGSNLTIPGRPSGRQTFRDPEINAAILALQHSFIVQKWDVGSGLGTLHVRGSIAQLYRGPVGTAGGRGYEKDYEYDSRLSYLSPPHFIDPVKSYWQVRTWEER